LLYRKPEILHRPSFSCPV